jgi:hypothetical protein
MSLLLSPNQVRIQAQARRRQAADRLAALRVDLANEEEAAQAEAVAQAEEPVVRRGTLCMANRSNGAGLLVHCALTVSTNTAASAGVGLQHRTYDDVSKRVTVRSFSIDQARIAGDNLFIDAASATSLSVPPDLCVVACMQW